MDVFTASTTKGPIYESERKLSKETVFYLYYWGNTLVSSSLLLTKKLKVYQCISVHVFTEIQLGSLHRVTSTHTQNEQDAD